MANYRGQVLPFNELADMHLMLGQCHGRSAIAAREYALLYPDRVHPSRHYFDSVDRRLREIGSFVARIEGRGQNVSS